MAGGVRLWVAGNGRVLVPGMRHERGAVSLWGVQGAAFSGDGKRVLSWGGDGAVRLWDVATGAQIGREMRHERSAGGVRGAAFSRDEGRVLSWGGDGAVRLWDVSGLPAGNLLEVACKLLPSRDMSDTDGVYGIRIADPICPGCPTQGRCSSALSMPLPDWSQME